MPIVRNPNSATALANRIDRQTESQIVKTNVEVQDLNAAGFELIVAEDAFNWDVLEVSINFNNATARDFSISKLVGARVIANLNDTFWMRHSSLGPVQRIIIGPGFYITAAAFAAAIKVALDAQTEFAAAGIVFTVTHSATTGLLTISPSAGTVQFIYNTGTNAPVSNPVRNIGLAGVVMGFNVNSVDAATITGDTAIDVGTEYDYISQIASVVTSYVSTDAFKMDMDSALKVSGVTGPATEMTARVTHEVVRSIR